MRFKKIIDLSVPLDPRTVWMQEGIPDPTEKASGLWGKKDADRGWIPWMQTLKIERVLEPSPYQGLSEYITIYGHTGTHVDSEYQHDPKGQKLFDMPLDAFSGEAVALDISFVGPKKEIRAKDLQPFAQKIESIDAVFMYSNYPSWKDAPWITYESTLWLIERGIKAFGMGGTSIYHDLESHELWHRKQIAIYDRLNTDGLKSLGDKRFFFVGFPLRIDYLSTSPCRVIAFED